MMISFRTLLLLSTLFLFSCGGDPDPVIETEPEEEMLPLSEQLIGTHFLFSYEVSGCEDVTENMAPSIEDSNGCVDELGDLRCNASFTFNADGTASFAETVDGDIESSDFTYTYDEITDMIGQPGGFTDDELLIFDEEGLRFIDQDNLGCREIFAFRKRDFEPKNLESLSGDLLGTHNLFSYEISGCSDLEDNIAPSTADNNGCVDEDGNLHCGSSYTFKADGTVARSNTLNGTSENEEFNYVYDETTDLIHLVDGLRDYEFLVFDEAGLRFFEQDSDGCRKTFTYKQ